MSLIAPFKILCPIILLVLILMIDNWEIIRVWNECTCN